MDMVLNKLPWNAAWFNTHSLTAEKSIRAAQFTARRNLQAWRPWTQKSRRDFKIDPALPRSQCQAFYMATGGVLKYNFCPVVYKFIAQLKMEGSL